jgi:hypothetical protein
MAYAQEKLKTVISVPTSSSILTVDTRDGLTYDSQGYPTYKNPYDIDIYKNSPIFRGKINRIALTNFSMKYTTQNVNPYNNLLVLEDGLGDEFRLGDHQYTNELGETATATISFGFYQPDELASQIQTVLRNSSALGVNTWSVSFDKDECIFTISNTSSKFFRINPMFGKDKGTVSVGGPVNPIIYKRTSTLASIMGFDNSDSSTSQTKLSATPSMNYTSYIDLVSNTITVNQFTRDVSTDNDTGYNLLARIYLNDNMKDYISVKKSYSPPIPPSIEDTLISTEYKYNFPGSKPMMINWEAEYPKQIRWDKEAFLAGVQIQLKDDMGNLLYYKERITGQAGDTGYALMTFMISEQDD